MTSPFRRAIQTIVVMCVGLTNADCGSVPEKDVPQLDLFEIGGDFSATAHDGRRFSLADLRGDIVLMFFGYTYCPDFCPLNLSKLAAVERMLGPDKPVHSLFVSVDPVRDTPELLTEYLAAFGVQATGLTGSDERIRSLAAQYGAGFHPTEERKEGGYLIDHTTRTYLIDRQGRLRYIFGQDDTPELMASVVERLF